MKDRIKHWPSTAIGFALICIASAYFVYAEKATLTEAVTAIITLSGLVGIAYKPKTKSNEN